MTELPELPAELARYVDPYYVEAFGEFPEFPRKRMALGGAIAPEATAAAEEFRRQALYSDVFDKKTPQLLAFCLLVSRASAGSYWHAKAARKYGASWEELHKVMEIAALINGVSAMNEGG